MTDIQVVAVIKAKPGGEGLVREALTGLVPPTRAEAGCVSYDLYESDGEPGTFITIELWRARSDLDGHMQSEHIAAVFASAGEALAQPPAIHVLNPVVVG
jgi:quinol monooxygenase YgiN